MSSSSSLPAGLSTVAGSWCCWLGHLSLWVRGPSSCTLLHHRLEPACRRTRRSACCWCSGRRWGSRCLVGSFVRTQPRVILVLGQYEAQSTHQVQQKPASHCHYPVAARELCSLHAEALSGQRAKAVDNSTQRCMLHQTMEPVARYSCSRNLGSDPLGYGDCIWMVLEPLSKTPRSCMCVRSQEWSLNQNYSVLLECPGVVCSEPSRLRGWLTSWHLPCCWLRF